MGKLLGGVLAAAIAFAAVNGEEKKAKPKPVISAVEPHPLDTAFEGTRTEQDILNGLRNNKLFQRAVKEALKKHQEQQKLFRENPEFKGATPAKAARVQFLKVLLEEQAPVKANTLPNG